MSDPHGKVEVMSHVTRAQRAEMVRAHAGIVTAWVAGDEEARSQQLASIVRDHAEAARGDILTFAGLMGKQVEAGAALSYTLVRMLAKRLNLSDAETQEAIAQAVAQVDDSAFPE